MAKTNKQPRSKSGKFRSTPVDRTDKAKAPKKPTQLDRIEQKLDAIHRTVVVRADSIHATLVDIKRSIGSIESKLASLYAWERLEEAMSNDKLASPTVAVEEKWVPKVGDIVASIVNYLAPLYRVEEVGENGVMLITLDKEAWRFNSTEPSCIRPATLEEIAAHEAKVKAEAQAAEDAKPITFGTRVEYQDDKGWRVACDQVAATGFWVIVKPSQNKVQCVSRRQFKVLD